MDVNKNMKIFYTFKYNCLVCVYIYIYIYINEICIWHLCMYANKFSNNLV